MSFSAIPLTGSKPEQYAQLLEQARALLHDLLQDRENLLYVGQLFIGDED